MKRRWIVGDVETTGVSATDRVVEIAWLEVNEELEILEEFCTLVDPEMPIPPGASGVHNITNKDVVDSPTIEQVFSIVRDGPLVGDIVLLAHSAPFDLRFFRPWCNHITGTIDSLRLSRLHFPDLENHRLSTLRYAFELNGGTAHRALGDVYTLLEFFKLLKNEYGLNLTDCVKEQEKPIRIQRMPFGKHRNMPLDAVPLDYLQWLSGLKDIDPDLLYTVNLILEERT